MDIEKETMMLSLRGLKIVREYGIRGGKKVVLSYIQHIESGNSLVDFSNWSQNDFLFFETNFESRLEKYSDMMAIKLFKGLQEKKSCLFTQLCK